MVGAGGCLRYDVIYCQVPGQKVMLTTVVKSALLTVAVTFIFGNLSKGLICNRAAPALMDSFYAP